MLLDFVVVAFRADFPLLRLQARSMALHLDPSLPGQLIVIGNAPDDPALAADFEREIRPEYGPLASRVRWVNERELLDFTGTPRGGNGWRRQQALKLEAHRLVRTPAYVTLDCKNHFIRPTGRAAFVDEGGRLRIHPRQAQPRQMGAFDLFRVPEDKRPETMFHIITPFPMMTAEVAAMDKALRDLTGQGSADAILSKDGPDVAEYRLYCAHLVAARGGWDKDHVLTAPPAITFFARGAEIGPFLRRVDDPGTRIMGVHRRVAWSPDAERTEIVRRWVSFGLISDEDEGMGILTPPAGAKAPP